MKLNKSKTVTREQFKQISRFRLIQLEIKKLEELKKQKK